MNEKYKIYKNHLFVECIKRIINHEKDEREKINLIEETARYMAYNVTGKYSDIFLEEQLLNIGKTIKFKEVRKPIPNSVLHVMTAAGITGGHTRVVNNWIEFDVKRCHSIVFTVQKNSIPKFLIDTVEKSGGKIYYLHGSNKKIQAENLLKLSSAFEKIILSIHMYDTIPIIAYSNKNWTVPIYLYNHANFRFWLGVSIADLVFDISNEDLNKSTNDRGVSNSWLLPIPIKNKSDYLNKLEIDDLNKIKIKYNLPINSKIITSMAEDYKYTVVKGYDFPQLMIDLIKRDSNVYIIIIGGNPKDMKWKQLINTKKARVLGRLNHDEVENILNITDVYIDSFPLPSFTCILEAMVKKIPVISYDVKRYRLDTLKPVKCKTLKQLVNRTQKYLENKNLYNYKAVQTLIEENHYTTHWLEKLEDAFSENLIHKVSFFKSRFVVGEYERMNNIVEELETKEKYNFFGGLSARNTMIIKIIAKLFAIDLK